MNNTLPCQVSGRLKKACRFDCTSKLKSFWISFHVKLLKPHVLALHTTLHCNRSLTAMAELALAAAGAVGVALTVADVGLRSIEGLRARFHKSENYHKELVLLQDHVLAYRGVLQNLKTMTENVPPDDLAVHTLEHLNTNINTCQEAMDVVNERLEKSKNSFLSQKLRISLHKIIDQKTASALEELDRTKSVLNLALQSDLRKHLQSMELLAQEKRADGLLADFSKVDVRSLLQSYLDGVRSQALNGTWLFAGSDWRLWMLQTGNPILLRGRCK